MAWLRTAAGLVPGGWTLEEKVFILVFLLNLLAGRKRKQAKRW